MSGVSHIEHCKSIFINLKILPFLCCFILEGLVNQHIGIQLYNSLPSEHDKLGLTQFKNKIKVLY